MSSCSAPGSSRVASLTSFRVAVSHELHVFTNVQLPLFWDMYTRSCGKHIFRDHWRRIYGHRHFVNARIARHCTPWRSSNRQQQFLVASFRRWSSSETPSTHDSCRRTNVDLAAALYDVQEDTLNVLLVQRAAACTAGRYRMHSVNGGNAPFEALAFPPLESRHAILA